MGTNLSVDFDLRIYSIGTDVDYFLLCSDGLWSIVTEQEIQTEVYASGSDLEKSCQNLINLSKKRGAPDNVSIVLIKLLETTTPKVYYDRLVPISVKDRSLLNEFDKIVSSVYLHKFRDVIPLAAKQSRNKKLLQRIMLCIAVGLLAGVVMLLILTGEKILYSVGLLQRKFEIKIENYIPGSKIHLSNNTIYEGDVSIIQKYISGNLHGNNF